MVGHTGVIILRILDGHGRERLEDYHTQPLYEGQPSLGGVEDKCISYMSSCPGSRSMYNGLPVNIYMYVRRWSVLWMLNYPEH